MLSFIIGSNVKTNIKYCIEYLKQNNCCLYFVMIRSNLSINQSINY